jgi:hypothetical protein
LSTSAVTSCRDAYLACMHVADVSSAALGATSALVRHLSPRYWAALGTTSALGCACHKMGTVLIGYR